MPSEKHQAKIQEIKETFEKNNWNCETEVPVIRNGKTLIDSETGRIDLCCQKARELRCFEVEKTGEQVVKNARDLRRMEIEAKQKGIKNYKGCQLTTGENFKEVCK